MLDFMPYHLLFTLLFLFGIFSANHACNQIDRHSLLSLAFNHTSFPPLNWSSIDCCQWEGISCDHKRQVTHIWLPSKGLTGSISPSLGNLTCLSHLNLSHNSLSGPLPKGLFSSLNQLKVLDLSYNCLFGDISAWPASIQVVDISSNQFNEIIRSSSLQRAWRLTELNVSNNSFMGPIPSFPCINSSLVSLLDFSHNHHSGHIPSGLGACSKLKVFRAGFNSLSGPLPDDLYNVTGLKEISLPSNDLSGPISSDIVNLTKLTSLELYRNELSGKLPVDIGKFSKLKYLLLDENSLSGSLPPSLVNCTNLTQLILRDNFLEGDISFFNFSGLHQLTIIDLGLDNFSGNLPVSLYSCTSLTAIRLSKNRLDGQISPEIVQLKFLAFLSVSYNRLTNITCAIKILMCCKTLGIVLLGNNFLHEAMPGDDTIAGSNGFENLRYLHLGACQLSGELPIWLSKLKKLEYLSLNSNRIRGSIPSWLSNLPMLFRLDLSNNLISGEFPKELCELPGIVSRKALVDNFKLDLPIFGSTITTQFNFLSNFRSGIHFANNNLSGNIPVEIGRLKMLSWLDLSHNNLSGNIPNQVSELTNLEGLDLSANRLFGQIPSSLSSLHFLSNFSVANNNLHGPIPSRTQLQSFDASTYEGNPELCGPPLPHECAHIVSNNKDFHDDDNGHRIPWFHITVILGFITGFWGVCGPLVISYKWRVAYFQFMDSVKDRFIIFIFKIAHWSL
ncbi:receptor-like protein 2 [Alnus glutinosa]|uniref:receptor-like protein 2 n=1 Tax=Alnus glutinosa TaxID=3517 RepID=UPI002D7839BA|nr:receptor-like protein 2 [Alnus glutinosa]